MESNKFSDTSVSLYPATLGAISLTAVFVASATQVCFSHGALERPAADGRCYSACSQHSACVRHSNDHERSCGDETDQSQQLRIVLLRSRSANAWPPFFFLEADQRVERNHQWLEEYTFYSCCKFDEETNQRLARVKISTSSGIILHQCSYLKDCPVSNGDTLIVVLVPTDSDVVEDSDEQCF